MKVGIILVLHITYKGFLLEMFCPRSSTAALSPTWSTGVLLQKSRMMLVSLSLNRWVDVGLCSLPSLLRSVHSLSFWPVYVRMVSNVNMGICWRSQSWEWVVSLDFDWQYISGKKKFGWPMVCFVFSCSWKAMVDFVCRPSISSIATASCQP